MRWPILGRNRRSQPVATLHLTKVQSCQSPGLVAAGWEEERTNNYWAADNGDLYEVKRIYTQSINEFILENNK